MSKNPRAKQRKQTRDYLAVYEIAFSEFNQELSRPDAVKAAKEYVKQLKIGDRLNSRLEAELNQLHV